MALKSRKALFAALGILVAGYLLYHFRGSLHLGQFSGAKLWEALRGADPLYILASVILIYVCYFLRAIRWQNLQKHVGTAHIIPIFNMTLAGFSAVFLFSRLGEPVRPMLISRKEKIPLADTFGIYALERFLDLVFSVVVLASWFITVTIQKFLHPGGGTDVLESARKTAGTLLTVGIIGLVVLIVYLRTHGGTMLQARMEVWLAAHGWRAKIYTHLARFGLCSRRFRGTLVLGHSYLLSRCAQFRRETGQSAVSGLHIDPCIDASWLTFPTPWDRGWAASSYDWCIHQALRRPMGVSVRGCDGYLHGHFRGLYFCWCAAVDSRRVVDRRVETNARARGSGN